MRYQIIPATNRYRSGFAIKRTKAFSVRYMNVYENFRGAEYIMIFDSHEEALTTLKRVMGESAIRNIKPWVGK